MTRRRFAAPRIELDSFWEAMGRFNSLFGIPNGKLPAILSDSVACRIESDSFWEAMGKFNELFGIPNDKLPTILSNGVACRIESGSFWEAMGKFNSLFDIPNGKLPTILSGGVACRIESDSLWETIHWLKDKGVEKDKIYMAGGSFWAASDKSSFRPTIDLLLDEYGFHSSDLPMRDAFWSRVSKDCAFDALRDKLAECRTTGHVNVVIKNMNGTGSIGRGATRCKFVRPKLTHERVEPARATKQSTLGSFFK